MSIRFDLGADAWRWEITPSGQTGLLQLPPWSRGSEVLKVFREETSIAIHEDYVDVYAFDPGVPVSALRRLHHHGATAMTLEDLQAELELTDPKKAYPKSLNPPSDDLLRHWLEYRSLPASIVECL